VIEEMAEDDEENNQADEEEEENEKFKKLHRGRLNSEDAATQEYYSKMYSIEDEEGMFA